MGYRLVFLLVCSLQYVNTQTQSPQSFAFNELGPCEEGKYCDEGLDLGCFEQGEATGFCHQQFIPQPTNKDLSVTLYSTLNDNLAQPINVTDKHSLNESIANLKLNKNDPLWVVLYGYAGNNPHPWPKTIMEALHSQQNATTITVPWGYGPGPNTASFYLHSASNTRFTGALVASVLKRITHTFHIQPSQVTVVGFSAAGQAAAQVAKNYPGLGRLIGLDPAKLAFYLGANDSYPTKARMHKSDAKYVVVMSTDANKQNTAAPYQLMGDVNIYVNGGEDQPGCNNAPGCDHERAVHLFMGWLAFPNHCTRVADCESLKEWQLHKCWIPTTQTTNEHGCSNQLHDLLFSEENQNLSEQCKNRTVYFNMAELVPTDLSYSVPSKFCDIEYRLRVVLAPGFTGSLGIKLRDSEHNSTSILQRTLVLLYSATIHCYKQKFKNSPNKTRVQMYGVTTMLNPTHILFKLQNWTAYSPPKIQKLKLQFLNGRQWKYTNIKLNRD